MKVLYVTNKPIYPLVDGGCVAMDSFLSLLIASNITISHLCVSTHKHPFEIDLYPLEVRNKISIDTVFIDTKFNPFQAIKSIFRNTSYNIDRFYSSKFAEKLKENILSHHPDAIVLDNSFMLIYITFIRQFFKGKIIARSVNVEFKIWEDYALFESSLLKKIALKYLSKQMKKVELKLLRNADSILTITSTDADLIRSFGNTTPIHVIPHTLTIDKQTNFFDLNSYFFIGAYNWRPNYDAVIYLLNDLFPNILKVNPKANLHIAGSFTPDEFYKYASPNVFIHGKIDSPKLFMKKHGIMLAPLFSGSGVRIKVLEAFSYGVPVIASRVALQGINGKVCIESNNTDEFIKEISNLTTHKLEKFILSGLSYIENEHDPIKIGQKLYRCVK